MTGDASDNSLFSDDPIDGSEQAPDRLGREPYAAHLVTLLTRVRQQSLSSVLAMIGPWGSGKSSVLGMTVRALQQVPDNGWLIAEFNPWSYSDLETLQNGFFAELRAALPEDGRWGETRKRIGEFGRAISPVGKVAGLFGIDAEGVIGQLSKVVSGDTSASATKSKAEEALRQVGRPILVVLDDLDRLDPAELLLVLKLVRQVGRLPHVYYLLCYDERTLLDVLMRTDLVGDKEPRARDYLEKIVQVRLDLPTLRDQQISILLNDGLEAVLRRNEVHLGVDDQARLQKAYEDHLNVRLVTPRAINRLLAQVDAFYAMLSREVNFVDFFCITWIRTAEPGLYRLIQQRRSDLTGTSLGWLIGKDPNYEEERAKWVGRLKNTGVEEEHTEGLMEFLSVLFLPIRSVISRASYGPPFFEDLAMKQGVGHIDYFDRYFAFGVPEEDIADSTVLQGLELISAERTGDAATQLVRALRENPERVLRKLRGLRAAGHRQPVPLLRLIAAEYGQLSGETTLLLGGARSDAERFAYDLLCDVEPQQGIELLRELAVTDHGLRLLLGVASRNLKSRGDSASAEPLSWAHDALVTITDLVKDRLMDVSQTPLRDLPDAVFGMFWFWRELGPTAANRWLYQQADSGHWDLLDVLSRLVPVGIASSGGGGRPALGDLSLGMVDEILGLDWVLDELSREIEAAERVDDPWALAPTEENRRACALWALKRERSRRTAP